MKDVLLISGKCYKCECDLHKYSVSSKKDTLCRYCYNQYQRDYNKSQISIKKNKARNIANLLVRSGIIIMEPCKLCGDNEAEKHHPNYDNPSDVTFLCKNCHTDFHKLQRKIKCA